jgi:DNA polymerase I-like protein with 3'-5' exonuclease and polymerase domains
MGQLPGQSRELYEMEVGVTSMLLDMERRGLRVDLNQVKIEEFKSKAMMCHMSERLEKILGYCINPNSSDDMHDVMCNFLGLPVLLWTNEEDDAEDAVHNPSFNKDAMIMYKQLPEVRNNPKATEVVELLTTYRAEATMNSLFWEPWPVLAERIDDRFGLLHSDYNQTVRSGRMSCKEPNAQQLNKRAKKCIWPRDGHCFLSMDESQIENRLSVHYHGNVNAVRAYVEDPKTDAHRLVGDMCGVTRRTGKTINLALNFGMGKKKTVANLMACEDLLVDNPSPFELKRRGESVYNTFHRTVPELKHTQHEAMMCARRRGFVFNNHGRRLHLPPERCHIAFNRIVQSEAADLFKEVCLNAHELIKGRDVYIDALVHDEALYEVPVFEESYWVPRLTQVMITPKKPYKVPLMTSHDVSYKSWGDCAN